MTRRVKVSQMRPLGKYSSLLVSLPNGRLSLPTPGMGMGGDDILLATCADGTFIPKLVGSFPRMSSLSNRPPLVVY